jgi:hypothetical protein
MAWGEIRKSYGATIEWPVSGLGTADSAIADGTSSNCRATTKIS